MIIGNGIDEKNLHSEHLLARTEGFVNLVMVV